MENLFETENLGFLMPKKMKIKFGLGSALLIGELKTWFNNIFEIDDPIGSRLRKFEILPSKDENATILINLFENEWGAFYELLEQFCFKHGFGGSEKELRENLEIWRKREIKDNLRLGAVVKDQKFGVSRVVKIMPVMVDIISVDGEMKRCKKTELINIS